MSSPAMRVAVVGAGISGLTAIKCCVDEGLEPVCFERTSDIGGLWRYREDVVEGQGCVMKSTVINVSKEMMSYSDFPVPDHFPVFMHNKQVVEYFEMYANKFDLEKYIQYNTEVILIKKAENFTKYGQWVINYRNRKTGEEKTEVFDAVLVCTGHHAEKYEPELPGLKSFKGKVMHSHDYKHSAGFEDKRVLVVGIGNSGGDIATETSRCARQVYLSTRRGTWIFHRVSDNGLPLDMLHTRRVTQWLRGVLPQAVVNAVVRGQLNRRIDHELYCLKPKYEPLQQHPCVNDDMPNRIICGAIQVKADIKTFTETGVEFIDGTAADNIDVVVLATGYSFGFPFIDKEVIDVKENVVNLYLNTFLPDLDRQTMAIVGCVQGFGAITPAVEMQSRAATRVFKRLSFLPSKSEMWAAVKWKHADNAKRYAKSRRHTIQVEILEFVDGLAQIIGCKYDLWKLFWKDPRLAFACFFGPLTPYQGRLVGPGKWSGARDAIMKQWDRVYVPFQTRPVEKSTKGVLQNPAAVLGWLIVIYFIIAWIF